MYDAGLRIGILSDSHDAWKKLFMVAAVFLGIMMTVPSSHSQISERSVG
jgi:hypothetical protein